MSSTPSPKLKRVHTQTLQQMKQRGEKIVALTAYDYSFAKLFDQAGIDLILVGDSAANVMAGHENTLPITLDEMIYHARCVSKAVQKSFVLVDLPFGSYQGSVERGLHAALRVMKETGAQGVKLEGGSEIIDTIREIVKAGIPVMAHLGLRPQSIHQYGSYEVRAKEKEEAETLQKEALLIEKAGCFGLLLEKIPQALAGTISQSLHIPTIGIGAGVECDGQILVMHDLLGLTQDFHPKFVRRYLDLQQNILRAVSLYASDVKKMQFPSEQEHY